MTINTLTQKASMTFAAAFRCISQESASHACTDHHRLSYPILQQTNPALTLPRLVGQLYISSGMKKAFEQTKGDVRALSQEETSLSAKNGAAKTASIVIAKQVELSKTTSPFRYIYPLHWGI